MEFSPLTHANDFRIPFNLLERNLGLRITWIPKNMCSTLKLSVAVSAGIVPEVDIPAFISNPEWIHNWTWPLEPRHALEADQNISIAVLRNPTSRLRSALLEKAIYQVDGEFNRIIGKICWDFSHYNKVSPEDFTFKNLLEAIGWFPDRIIDHHFCSQVSFLSGKYHKIFLQEQPKLIEEYLDSIGFKLYTINMHRISHLDGEAKTIEPDTPIRSARAEFRSDGAPRAFCPELEAALEALAADRYAHDVILWNNLTQEPS